MQEQEQQFAQSPSGREAPAPAVAEGDSSSPVQIPDDALARRALLGLSLPQFCILAIVTLACVAPFDAALLEWLRSLFAPGSRVQDFVVGLGVLGTWRSGAVINLLMLLHPRRWWLLGGYAVPVLICSAGVHIAKFLIGRARPYLPEVHPWQFQPFSDPMTKFDSFPSGHSFYAFVLVGLLSTYFPAFRWLFLLLGGMVALSRVVGRAHWPSDTVAGAALGCLVVYACVRAGGRKWYALQGLPRSSEAREG